MLPSGKRYAMTISNHNVRLFGLGCNLSRQLLANLEAAAEELDMELGIEEVSDIQEMLDLGITAIPALQIGEEVVVSGRVLQVDAIKALLADYCESGIANGAVSKNANKD